MIGVYQVQQNPKLKSFKRWKRNGNDKISTTTDAGLLESVKKAALTTIKVASDCVKEDDGKPAE